MNSIRQIQRLNDLELQNCTPPNGSWHTDYRDTAYIHIGGLPFDLSEGDVLTIFSQYGNPVHINLVRDKDTGKSRGFAFLKYEDQRSCELAVDNLSGASVLGRMLSVDHARYKMKEGEKETVGDDDDDDEEEEDGTETDRECEGRRKRRRTDSQSSEEERPAIKEEVELAKLMREHDDDDPMKAYLVKEKKAEVEEAMKRVAISKPKKRDEVENGERKHRHRHRHRFHGSRGKADVHDENGKRKVNMGKPRRREESGEEDHERSKPRPARSPRRDRSPSRDSSSDERHRQPRRSDRENDPQRRRRHGSSPSRSPSKDRDRRR